MEQSEPQTQLVTPRSSGIRYGVIYGVIGIVLFLILALTGLNTTQGTQWINPVIAIVIVVFAHKYYKDNGDGFMSYGQGFGIAAWIGIIGCVISSVFMYIYIKFVDANFVENIRNKAIDDMHAQGQSDEQIEMAMKFLNMFTSAEALFFMGIFLGILTLLFIGLIVSIFTKKDRAQSSTLD